MKIADIYSNDVTDGIGVCVSVWFQGCNRHCKGCQNPGTWDPNGGKDITIEELIQTTVEYISANGIQCNLSILGGEPLAYYNINATAQLITAVKAHYPNIKVFLWTGFIYDELLTFNLESINTILNNIDVLIDGPFILEKRDISLQLRGSSNQRILVKNSNNKFEQVNKI